MTKKPITSSGLINYFLLLGAVIFAFIFGPFHQLNGFEMVPGDLGDARLNNYFLENIYLFLIGKSQSLIHLNFFSPFPYVLGFSDNLFGASPVYVFFRGLTGEFDTAFQYWFYLGYIFNYFAAYFGLRMLKVSSVAAIFGAIIFAFALPVDAQMNHAQMGYRFTIPFAMAYFYLYLETASIQKLLHSVFWLVWTFYCSIYMGVFTTFFLALLPIIFFLVNGIGGNNFIEIYRNEFTELSTKNIIAYGIIFLMLMLMMVLLMYPYLKASSLYGFKRSYAEVLPMIPQIKSYLISDFSLLWGEKSRAINIPIRWEHQLFIGFIPSLLLFASLLIGGVRKKMIYLVFFGAMALSIFLTLRFGESQISAWYLLSKFPLLNSIRAIGRNILVLLFPIAVLCSLTIEYLVQKKSRFYRALIFLLFAGLLAEIVAVSTFSAMSKNEWRVRLIEQEKIFPKGTDHDSILFFSQKSGDTPWAAELDAMWIALLHSRSTLNGYSGNFPGGFQMEFGVNCLEMPRRVLAYLSFIKKMDQQHYLDLMRRVKPVGFNNCQDNWFHELPQLTTSNRPYTADVFKQLAIESIKQSKSDSYWRVGVLVRNNSIGPISALSSSGNPISLSYRFLDESGKPTSNWDPRIPLWMDIPGHGVEFLEFDVLSPPKSVFMELSLVQEGVFWSHDLGVVPKRIPLGDERAP